MLNSTRFHKKEKLNLSKLDQNRKLQKANVSFPGYIEEELQHVVHLNTIKVYHVCIHSKNYVPGNRLSRVLGAQSEEENQTNKQTRAREYKKLC